VDILIEAFAGLRSPVSGLQSILILVGDGPLEGALRARVKELEIEDRVIFAGRKAHDEIRYYMNACDIFCLPSRDEGCPNVLLEALSCGIPVVASQTGGIPEIIKNTDLGFLCGAGDADAIRSSIKQALSSNWNRENLCQSVSGRSWSSNAKKLFNLLNQQAGLRNA
jgi:glycosyltransferase involved in cell wall biosynthesis